MEFLSDARSNVFAGALMTVCSLVLTIPVHHLLFSDQLWPRERKRHSLAVCLPQDK